MPKRRNSKNLSTSSDGTANTEDRFTTPLHRSQRIVQTKLQDSIAHKPNVTNSRKDHPIKSSKKSNNSSETPVVCAIPASGLTKSLGFRNVGASSLRRSPRLALQGSTGVSKKSSGSNPPEFNDHDCPKSANLISRRRSTIFVLNNTADKEEVLLNKARGEVVFDLGEEVAERREGRTTKGSVSPGVVLGLKALKRENICERNKDDGVVKKTKKGKEGSKGSMQGWTREQEMALQNAYFAMKPTPHFWKKVSKLVPGKSAQECFDKIHSDHITPTQPMRQSRANQLNSSPLHCFSLSASKLLEPSGQKIKKMTCNKQKSHLAYKTLRQLLQNHTYGDQDYQADLFSVLEDNSNVSTQDSRLNVIPSTPQEKQGFLHNCNEKLSPCHQMLISRLSSSCAVDLVSPPVLKQVKSRALHEKYIDQLHCREAKRKATCAETGKHVARKENIEPINVQKIDVVKAAKNALVSNAMDAINQIKSLQANAMYNFCDSDDDGVESENDDVSENGL